MLDEIINYEQVISQEQIEDAWNRTLLLLADIITGPAMDNHIKLLAVELQSDGTIALIARDTFSRDLISSNNITVIREVFQKSLGFKPKIILKAKPREETDEIEQYTMQYEQPKNKNNKDSLLDSMSLPLNDEYCFDTFVIGGNNRLATACAQAVAEKPGRTYNPLFIYGDSGLGKTHLMHAIGHEIYKKNPNAKVYFTSGEAFTSLYVDAARENKIPELRKKFKNIDLFLLDDVQFLMGKEKTVEEFFHMFNTLYDTKKQIVLTSDRAPKELSLDQRLLSRFEQGMLADIKHPDLETRMAILYEKAQKEGMFFTSDVIEYVAKLIKSNIRQLMGALTQLLAQSSLLKQEVTLDFAKQVLEDYYKTEGNKIISVDFIQDKTADFFKITKAEMLGTSRSKEIVIARQAAMYAARELTEMSLPAIGKAFGGKDHTTVLHNCKKIEERLKNDHNFRLTMNEIISKMLE